MGRARRSALSIVLVMLGVTGATMTFGQRPMPIDRVAAVGWPTATLLVSEVVTGGASASDEFVELVNAGPIAVDLAGLEVVYATSSGSTVTRKSTWATAQPVGPGQHLLLANGAGSYAGDRRRHVQRRPRRRWGRDRDPRRRWSGGRLDRLG